jgi:hypothetical protein
LQRAALDRQIRERLWARLRRSARATNSMDQLVLTPADRAHYIAKLSAEAFAAKKITPALIAANTNLAAYVAEAQALRPSIKKGSAELIFRHPPASKSPGAARYPATKLVPPPDPTEAVLLATFPVTDADFETLVASRAQAVQAYLLQVGKVEAGRIFVTSAGTASLRRDGSRAYLQFR